MSSHALSNILICNKCHVPLHIRLQFTAEPHSAAFQCPYCRDGLEYHATLAKSTFTKQIEIKTLILKDQHRHFPLETKRLHP